MKITAVIVEDEEPARATLRAYLRNYFPNVRVLHEVDNIKDTVQVLKMGKTDIVFLDVQLKDGLGMQALLDLENLENLKIIFTTAFENFAAQAFKFKPFGYLLKPLNPLDFKEIMNRAIKDIKFGDQSEAKIKITTKFGYELVSIFEIVRCQAESNYTLITTSAGKTHIISKTLKFVEEELLHSDHFVRIHHSHLVNMIFVDKNKISSNKLTLTNGDQVPVSRGKRQDLMNRINELNLEN
jgi:two-component system LytT family response regulator